jgi:hypothetical protein
MLPDVAFGLVHDADPLVAGLSVIHDSAQLATPSEMCDRRAQWDRSTSVR